MTASLKTLLKKGPVVVPGGFDPFSALLIEKAGFKVMYLSGGGLSVTFRGQPDIGLLTRDEVVDAVKRIRRVAKLPLIVDADTGFGGPAQVAATVRALEKAGADAIQIEDQTFPKRCGHLAGKEVISIGEMVRKVRAAVQARRSPGTLIVARTDARAVEGVANALARAEAYTRAGADLIFPEALETIEEFRLFGRKKELGTLMANMTEFGRSPTMSASDLARMGFRLILYPMTALRVAAHSMEKALNELKKGRHQVLLRRMQTRKELYQLIRYHEYE